MKKLTRYNNFFQQYFHCVNIVFSCYRAHVVSSQSWDNTPPINNNIMDDKVSEKTRRATLSSEGSFQKEDLDNQDDGWSTDELSQTEDEDEDGDIFLQTAEVILIYYE